MNSLNKAYRYFNDALFDGELPDCILTIARKNNTHGYFSPNRWRKLGENGHTTHEIALTATTLYREPLLVFSTLVHEQVHLWQQEFGKPSRNGYHNKEWGRKMESIGLMPSNTGKPNGKKTGQQMTHYIIEGGAYETAFKEMPNEYLLAFTSLDADIMKAMIEGRGKGSVTTPKGGVVPPKGKNKVKYTCSCGNNVWGKPSLTIVCGDCEQQFVAQN